MNSTASEAETWALGGLFRIVKNRDVFAKASMDGFTAVLKRPPSDRGSLYCRPLSFMNNPGRRVSVLSRPSPTLPPSGRYPRLAEVRPAATAGVRERADLCGRLPWVVSGLHFQ